MPSIPARVRSGVVAMLALAMAATVALPTMAQDASPAPAPILADPATEGGALATRFLEILGLPDAEKAAELETFLAPAFQLVRANGSRLDKTAYIGSPATVDEFLVSDVVTTQADDVVVVSYLLATTETIDGVGQTTTAPRLSVFHWSGTSWQLTAHGNFGAIAAPDPSPDPAG